jgi:phage-related protein
VSELLPPLVQEFRANYKDVLDSHEKIIASQEHMVEKTNEQSERMGHAFGGAAKLAAGAAVAVAAVAVAAVVKIAAVGLEEVKETAASNAQLAAGIISTGNAANLSVSGMDSLAKSISNMSGQTQASLLSTESILQTFTAIKNTSTAKVFDDATLAAANMAAKLPGYAGDSSKAAIQLGKALNDPEKGVAALSRVGVSFTQGQKDSIKAMQDAGDMAGAQNVILKELNTEFGGAAKAAGETLPGSLARAKNSFKELAGTVVEQFSPILTTAASSIATMFQRVTPGAEEMAKRVAGALGSAAKGVHEFMDGFKNGTSGVNSSKSMLADWGDRVQGIVHTVGDALTPVWNSIKGAVSQLAPTLGPLIKQFFDLAQSVSPGLIIFKALAPLLPQIIGIVTQLAQTIGGALGTAMTALTPVIGQIVKLLSGEFSTILKVLLPIVGKLAGMLGGLLGDAMKALTPLIVMVVTFIGKLLQAVMPLIGPILQLVMAFVPLLDPLVQLVGALLGPLVKLLMMVLDPVMQLVSALVGFLVPALTAVIQNVTSNFMPIIKGITEVLGGVIDFITGVFSGNWAQAWKGITEIFSGIWDTIHGVLLGAVNGMTDIINGVIAGINGIAGSIRDATGGAINISLASLPHISFDTGTDRVPGPTGAPMAATIHGGEVILSNAVLSGRAPVPPRAIAAVQAAQQAGQPGIMQPNTGPVTNTVNVTAITQASPSRIAADVGWVLRRMK